MAAVIGRQPLRPSWSSLLAGSSTTGGQLRRLNRPHLLLPLLPTAGGQRPPHSRHLRIVEAVPQAAAGTVLHAALLHQLAFDAAAAPAGDPSVLIPISTLLLLVYWVANFVVPGMISKDLQAGESSDQESTGGGDERRGG